MNLFELLESNNALDTTTQRWNKLKRECGGNSERNLKMCHAEIKVIMFDYLYYNAKTQIKFTISRKDSNRVIFIDYYVRYKCIWSGETTRNIVEDIVRIFRKLIWKYVIRRMY